MAGVGVAFCGKVFVGERDEADDAAVGEDAEGGGHVGLD